MSLDFPEELRGYFSLVNRTGKQEGVGAREEGENREKGGEEGKNSNEEIREGQREEGRKEERKKGREGEKATCPCHTTLNTRDLIWSWKLPGWESLPSTLYLEKEGDRGLSTLCFRAARRVSCRPLVREVQSAFPNQKNQWLGQCPGDALPVTFAVQVQGPELISLAPTCQA